MLGFQTTTTLGLRERCSGAVELGDVAACSAALDASRFRSEAVLALGVCIFLLAILAAKAVR